MSQLVGTSSRTFRTTDPARPSQTVVELTAASAADVETALATASAAATGWSRATAGHRSAALHRAADALAARGPALASLITREEGKPLAASTGEVGKAVEQLRFAAQLAYQVEGRTFPVETSGTAASTLRTPIGVVVAITPWNFPVSLAARKIAPALAAGNAVIFKPSPVTAGSGQLLAEALHEGGVPAEVLQVLHGDDRDAMAALVGSEMVAGVSFTGSDAVGALLRRQANPRARLQLELGGHNAAVVCRDADLDVAARHIVAGAFELTGQACTATDRVLVERSVLGGLLDRLEGAVSELVVGGGDQPDTRVGPVATRAQMTRLTDLLASASSAGTVVAQADVPTSVDPDGYWVPPTLLTDLPDDHPINTREVFGPLLSVVPVDSLREAIDVVNASRHGLVTAVHTRDLGAALSFAGQVSCGIVKVNARTTGNGLAPPFGGWKESSSGAFPEGGVTALDFVTDTKSVYISYEEA
jgi:alpha-ketoglutaric semialdehyde dehydrogenase